MNKLSPIKVSFSLPILVGFLSLDLDLNANRVQVLNRNSGLLIDHFRAAPTITRFLPYELSTSSNLICLMLDDDAEYNAAVADNVQPLLVDLVTFDPLNPFPYEPPVA